MTADQLKRADGAMEKQRCCNTKWTYGGYRRTCTKTAKVERDGKWYCGIHDPVARAEKAAARHANWMDEARAAGKAGAEQKRRPDFPKAHHIGTGDKGRRWKAADVIEWAEGL